MTLQRDSISLLFGSPDSIWIPFRSQNTRHREVTLAAHRCNVNEQHWLQFVATLFLRESLMKTIHLLRSISLIAVADYRSP